MKLIRASFCLLSQLLASGCAGLQAYSNTTDNNLIVKTTAPSSFSMKVEPVLHIAILKDGCKMEYLGGVELKNGETTVGVKPGQKTYLTFIFHTAARFGGSSSSAPYATILTPRPGARYVANVSYVNLMYNVTIHELGRGGVLEREIERQTRDCPDMKSIPR